MSQILTDGNDYIFAAQDAVYALDGNDRILTNLAAPDVHGGNGFDFIGNFGSGFMFGFGDDGNDTIHGGTTTDWIYGEMGSDLLVGGEFDYATAAAGSIVPFAGEVSGSDYLDGGQDRDALYGFDGNDTLLGGDGDDNRLANFQVKDHNAANTFYTITGGLYGGAGDDYLDGGRGNDYLDGGDNNDTLIGGLGNDTLIGGAGIDTIWADQGADTAFGGTGNDAIYSGLANAITAFGEAGNDQIATGNGNDYIDGGIDNDILFAGIGNDFLFGGNGSDALGGYIGNDIFYGDFNAGGLDYFNLISDVRAGEGDYIADFKAGGVQDYIILPTAYSGSVFLSQYGTDVIGYIAQGSSYYSFQVHSANPLTIAEVQAALFFA